MLLTYLFNFLLFSSCQKLLYTLLEYLPMNHVSYCRSLFSSGITDHLPLRIVGKEVTSRFQEAISKTEGLLEKSSVKQLYFSVPGYIRTLRGSAGQGCLVMM